MAPTKSSKERLEAENQNLRQKLSEAQETLSAIQHGEVDALVVSTPEGMKTYTLSGAEKPYRLLIEEMHEGAVMLSNDNSIIYSNRGFAEIIRLPQDKIVGSRLDESVISTHKQSFLELLLLSRTTQNISSREITFISNEGKLIPTIVSASCIKNDDTTITFIVVTDLTRHMAEDIKQYTVRLEREIAERKKAQVALLERTEQLEQTQKKLEENAVLLEEYSNQMEELAKQRLNKLKDAERLAAIGATAGMVGHDIRNPLQSIVTELYFAKKDLKKLPPGSNTGGVEENLSAIESSVTYINKIVQDLQDYARPINLSIQEINLQALCNEVLSTINIPPNIKTESLIAKNAEKVTTDPLILKRILTNLLNNAVQAMPSGGKLTFNARMEKNQAIISIADTGEGIPTEIREKLFTPLITTKARGQGFGLAVVKRMTEALSGTVSFESELGKGTIFTIKFPNNNSKRII